MADPGKYFLNWARNPLDSSYEYVILTKNAHLSPERDLTLKLLFRLRESM